MTDVQITGADIEAVAGKLDTMADAFTDTERAALYAVFRLAGASILGAEGDAEGDVEGFALNAYRNASFAFTLGPNEGILIGLNQGAVGGGKWGDYSKLGAASKVQDGVFKF